MNSKRLREDVYRAARLAMLSYGSAFSDEFVNRLLSGCRKIKEEELTEEEAWRIFAESFPQSITNEEKERVAKEILKYVELQSLADLLKSLKKEVEIDNVRAVEEEKPKVEGKLKLAFKIASFWGFVIAVLTTICYLFPSVLTGLTVTFITLVIITLLADVGLSVITGGLIVIVLSMLFGLQFLSVSTFVGGLVGCLLVEEDSPKEGMLKGTIAGALVGIIWPLAPIILFLIVAVGYALFTFILPALASFLIFILTSLPGLPFAFVVRSKVYSYYARKYGWEKVGLRWRKKKGTMYEYFDPWKEIPNSVKIMLIIACFAILFCVGAIISIILGLTTLYHSFFQQMADSINSIINTANEYIIKFPTIIGALSDFVQIIGKEPLASIIMYIATVWMYQSILPALIGGIIGSGIRGSLKS
jgi:hypothetical protein